MPDRGIEVLIAVEIADFYESEIEYGTQVLHSPASGAEIARPGRMSQGYDSSSRYARIDPLLCSS